MAIRAFPQLLAFLSLFLAGAAFAQAPGNTSGPASGDSVKPSTAIQKENSGRFSASGGAPVGSPNAAGAPGAEGKPGAQSGPTSSQPSK
jgi:hypothetical protein